MSKCKYAFLGVKYVPCLKIDEYKGSTKTSLTLILPCNFVQYNSTMTLSSYLKK